MTSLGITVFLRVDQFMIDHVLPHVDFGYPHNRHHAIWAISIDTNSKELIEWLGAQSKEAYAGAMYIPKSSGQLIHTVQHPSYIGLGVSYSKLNASQISSIAAKKNMSLIKVDALSQMNSNPTVNPLLRVSNTGEVYYYTPEAPRIIPKRPQFTPLEKQFIDSLQGHDFFYEYSDSLEVYKRGKRQEEELKAKGMEMGLTRIRVDALYAQTYQSLCSRTR